MDHDSLYKKLLTVFFLEFVESFLPRPARYIDPSSIEFLDKETFAGIRPRKRKEMDLVVKVRFKDAQQAFFLIHVEHQSTSPAEFPHRMFRYFIRLTEKYNLPVYPVVIFSHDKPDTPVPETYEVAFPDKTVLQFNYTVIQLNRLPWRKFVAQPNPVATALMTRMQIREADRPKVKAECLRLLVTLKLTPEKAEPIYVFIESYLKLNAEENRIYERELSKFAEPEKDEVMEIISSIRQEGRQEGNEEMLTLVLEQRFSTLPASITEKLDKLSTEELKGLAREIFNFQRLSELDEWLSKK